MTPLLCSAVRSSPLASEAGRPASAAAPPSAADASTRPTPPVPASAGEPEPPTQSRLWQERAAWDDLEDESQVFSDVSLPGRITVLRVLAGMSVWAFESPSPDAILAFCQV